MEAAAILGMEAILQVPRVLGLMDRDRRSRTYGCAERYYWHYRFHDFPNARFQETAELLALAFQFQHPRNPFHQQERVRDWALAAERYWESICRADGSFDEAYPFERSFCATAFSTLHATETLVVLGKEPLMDLSPIGRWLCRRDGLDTTNQRAASAAALANLGTLLGIDRYLAAAASRAADIRARQNRAGYFIEYGGEDVGYSSITLSALALYARRAGDRQFSDWVRSQASALGSRLDKDGAYSYAEQSRSTRFFYPFALAWAGDESIHKISMGVTSDRILRPSWMDDRYAAPFAADYLRSAVELSSQSGAGR